MIRLLLLILIMSSSLASADCRVNGGSASFGTQTSFVINSTVQTTTFNVSLDCDNVLSNNNNNVTMTLLNATASVNTHAALEKTNESATTDLIPIRLCAQSGCPAGGEIALNENYKWNGAELQGLLNNQHINIPLFLQTVSGQNVSAGLWQVNLALRVNYNICSEGEIVCQASQTDTADLIIQITLSVTNDCLTISAPDINFGSAPLVKDFPPVSQSISVTCTRGTVYTVGINNGNYASGNTRNMANDTYRMRYDIFKESSDNRWGNIGAERWASMASSQLSADGLLRTYNYTARILSTQDTPPAGSYSDMLIIDIVF